MTDEKINIAIAEICWWTEIHMWGPGFVGKPPAKYHHTDKVAWCVGYNKFAWLPRYVSSLDAMFEAEEMLCADIVDPKSRAPYSQRMYFASLLGMLTYNDNGRGWQPLSNDDCFPICHATARQRAEAFLRVFDKWEVAT